MAFLGNDAVNRVNLHSGIQALAQSGGGIFFTAFLVHAGIGVPAALVAQACILGLRFLLRPLVLPLAIRVGLQPLLIGGALVLATQYPLLARVHDIGPMLAVFCGVAALGDVLYWPTYHTYFAVIGDAHHRGHQVSAREAFVASVGVVAPLLGAWALVSFGATSMFAAIGCIQALSVLPLLGAPNARVATAAPNAYRAAKLAAQLALTSGWFDGWQFLVWQVALFVLLGSSFGAFGGAMALAAFVGAVFGLLLGKYVDAGEGRRTVVVAYSVATLTVALRALCGGAPVAAIAATASGAFAPPLMVAASGPPSYNLAQASPCPMRFHLVTEAGWDIGCGSACLVAAALIALGIPIALTTVLAIPAIAASTHLLWRYYGPAPARQVDGADLPKEAQ